MAEKIDSSMETLDPTAQQAIAAAADAWSMQRYEAPADKVSLLNNTSTPQGMVYEIEIDVAGALDYINLIEQPNGQFDIQIVGT